MPSPTRQSRPLSRRRHFVSGYRFEHQRFPLAGVKNRIEAGRVRRAIACAAVLLSACHLKVDAQQAGGSQPPMLVAFSIGAQHTASLRWRATEQLRSRLREAPNLSMLRIRHNAARAVSSHRQSQTPSINTQPIPLVMAASDRGRQGFVRIINHSDRAGTVDIHAIDDTGRRLGPVSLSLEAAGGSAFQLRGPGKREHGERTVRGCRRRYRQLATGACLGAAPSRPWPTSERRTASLPTCMKLRSRRLKGRTTTTCRSSIREETGIRRAGCA